MKAHLTERSVKGFQPQPKNIIVYDEEVVGFGIRITSGGTRAFILTYRIDARERRITIGAWPDWSVKAPAYPPDLQDAAVQTVLRQAEALSANWSQ
jgi:Arm DNA-binding domain